MISIVSAFYNRQALLDKTIESIKKSSIKDYELIVIDDASTVPLKCPEAKIIYVEKKDKWYTCSAVAFNRAMREAKGDIIIIQNPECYHVGDVLAYVQNNITPNTYLSFACYAINSVETSNFHNGIFPKLVDKMIDDGNGWYNHTKYRPVAYHFCSAILRKDLDRIGGFDERYALGVAFDDDDFIRRIKAKMTVKIVNAPYVIHQYHTHFEMSKPSAWGPYHAKNQALFNQGYDPNVVCDYSRNTELYPDGQEWTTIRDNYDKYYLNYDGDKSERIPKILHILWTKGEFPQYHIDLIDAWIAKHPTWELKIWTEQDVKGFMTESFIYRVLYRYGGVYIDTNFKCVKPLDDLLYLDFFCGGRRNNKELQTPFLSDKIIGCTRQNEFIRLVMERFDAKNKEYLINQYLKYIQNTTDKIILFPDAFFYPMPDCVINDGNQIRIDSYIKPQTYCIYLWNELSVAPPPPPSRVPSVKDVKIQQKSKRRIPKLLPNMGNRKYLSR